MNCAKHASNCKQCELDRKHSMDAYEQFMKKVYIPGLIALSIFLTALFIL